jgi:hypothetical protein
MLLSHVRFLVALLEMHWFKWTYFHERALLLPQRCCQGHGAANAASHGNQFPRGWQRRFCAALLGGDRRWGGQQQRTAVPRVERAAHGSAAKNRS